MGLDVEGYPNMPRNWSEAVPDGNGPVPQQVEFGSDQPTLVDVHRMIEEIFDKSDRELDELTENLRATDQRVTSLEQDARDTCCHGGRRASRHQVACKMLPKKPSRSLSLLSLS